MFIWLTKPCMYQHHGIYIQDPGKEGQVIHFDGSRTIETSTLKEFSSGCVVRRAPDIYKHGFFEDEIIYNRFNPKIVVQRAKSKLGWDDYCVLSNNCEHFASWCRCGTPCSAQIHALGIKPYIELLIDFTTIMH